MARKMATVLEAYSIGGTYSSDGSRLCTNSKAQAVGCAAVSGYGSKQIVPGILLTKAGPTSGVINVYVSADFYMVSGVYAFNVNYGVTQSRIGQSTKLVHDLNNDCYKLTYSFANGATVNTISGGTTTVKVGSYVYFWVDTNSTSPTYGGCILLSEAESSDITL